MTKTKRFEHNGSYVDIETVKIEDENDGESGTGFVYKAQRVDSDGFIRTVKVVDIAEPLEIGGGKIYFPGVTKTVEVSSETKKVVVKKDGSIERWLSD